MKIKRILSSALVAVMIFTTLVAIIPFKANAAYTASNKNEQTLNGDEVYEFLQDVYKYDYDSAEEMLEAEKEAGLLVSVGYGGTKDNPLYEILVNKYTGFLYYRNNWTGQILTSNPHNYPKVSGISVYDLTSQIVINFSEASKNTSNKIYSSVDAAERAQIYVDYITDGIRVNYTLGDTVARYLVPGRITAEKLESMLLIPMFTEFISLMEQYCADENYNGEDYDFFNSPKYSAYRSGHLNYGAATKYLTQMYSIIGKKNIPQDHELRQLYRDLMTIYGQGTNCFQLQNIHVFAQGSDYYNRIYNKFYTTEGAKINEKLEPIYEFSGKSNTLKSNAAIIFEKYTTKYMMQAAEANGEEFVKYTFTEMYEDEEYCGYVDETDPKPVFRCALEYTFNTDGSLSVRLPANSISFDETLYNLNSITILKYFGAADGAKDGYIFFPDGSGTIVDLKDFYDPDNNSLTSTAINSDIYGADNSYAPEVDPSKITGAYREQVSMPVFGVVGTEVASERASINKNGAEEITNGYFAILEKGASLATLSFQTLPRGSGNFGSAFCTYSPYPSDMYDLTDTISVGSADYYTIVSDAKFNGSYVTRYVMLTDKEIGENMGISYYESSYVGMANYYRDYLYENGTLSALSNVSKNLPLYIEALGSMDIITKVLSFPVTKSIPLTTFEDVVTMYKELYNCSDVTKEKADEYQALADSAIAAALENENKANAAATDSEKQKYSDLANGFRASAEAYQKIADNYRENIDNINFRLTGFGNGGLTNTYPTKLRWERACGGKRAFKELLETAADLSKNGDVFGIYPDYDFMYLSYTEIFDGISQRRNISKMIDNRYASKQIYDSISRQYVSHFSLVVSPESLNNLYSKFIKKYMKYDISTISVSTMGSDLNSNFDEDLPINRDDAQAYVESVLSRMVNENNLEVMLDTGNAYSLRYASHILNISTDSSHFRYSSYTVPFVGMILHGSVNYAGKPLNYSGSPSYDILRSIESGAALYYILCYQNESFMKNDEILNDYYGVKYESWYESIIKSYKELDIAIGDLQDYIISDHHVVIGERVIDEKEEIENYKILMKEIINMLDYQIDEKITQAYEELKSEALGAYDLVLDIDRDSLMDKICNEILNLSKSDAEEFAIGNTTFGAMLDELVDKHEDEQNDNQVLGGTPYEVEFDADDFSYGLSKSLAEKMLKLIRNQIDDAILIAKAECEEMNNNLAEDEKTNPYKVKFTIVREAILDKFAELCKFELDVIENYELDGKTLGEAVDAIIAEYDSKADEWQWTEKDEGASRPYEFDFNKEYIDFTSLYTNVSQYSFITESSAYDENYIYTDYTTDGGEIVLVTYQKGNHKVQFLLNYNIYSVRVNLGNGQIYELGKYEYVKIKG